MSRTFEAEYPGRCWRDDCPDPAIRPGERVRYATSEPGDKRLEHEACPEPLPPPNVCPTCFVALPLTGVCDNCG